MIIEKYKKEVNDLQNNTQIEILKAVRQKMAEYQQAYVCCHFNSLADFDYRTKK